MTLPQPPSGRFDGNEHLFPVRVYFEDTDLSGVVYHANYLRWFERARSDMLRVLGIDQRAAHEAGEGAYAVAEMHLRFARPAKLDDAVLIRSHVAELSPATCRIVQRAFRDDTLLCEATARVAFVAPNGRPRRQPRAWMSAFQTVSSQAEGPVPA
ncbi:acyl-CoA thioester hydrolase [Novosphingobium hassiacum]|uniref:Acyl-CoA thioester hydrolase n=1 Tax=Novosphingobium hassiacum TaxID=173676 RepID=A0A7W5ZWX7_9SPHN|nr:YbgC/FadM family acyl-CoA thioesterase [Novosphingobium hassiacum]MBB3861458.1 acyl-CoA thioester hydrolase [Novosphingobium hassiacum]